MPAETGGASPNQARHTHVQDGVTVGFFTDPTICIGCKACEVACKEWNRVPAVEGDWSADSSYDHGGALGQARWRHVKFVEQAEPLGRQVAGPMGEGGEAPFRWLFLSDVCKHCSEAGCLEACPTGSIVRTETGGVFVQDDICNGCGYCVVGCPFGVIDRRPEGPGEGGAFKCTFCYDRQKDGRPPACAQACPTESIRFGPLEELRERAARRLEALRLQGYEDVSLYDPRDTSVEGIHAFFLVPGDPGVLGLPARPEAPTAYLRGSWVAAAVTAAAILAVALVAFGLP